MSWSQQVFNYCERGLDPGFWAEPLNAASNAAFILAAGMAGAQLVRLPPPGGRPERGERLMLWLLVGLVAAIGIGSFLFHTFATRWALIADVGPITLFMVAYLAYALRVLLGLGWFPIALILPAFVHAGSLAGDLTCATSAAGGRPQPCLNGSLGYAPALLSLWIIGWLARRRGEAAGTTLLAAGAVFLVSAVLRTIDRDVCAATELLGHVRGTHALWHMLNAVTLYLLLSAAIGRVEGGAPGPVRDDSRTR